MWTQLAKFCCLQQWQRLRRRRRHHHDTQWLSERDMTADWTAQMKFHAAKVSEFDWRREKKCGRKKKKTASQVKSIRLERFSFQWEHSLERRADKSLRFCLAIKCTRQPPPSPFQTRRDDKQKKLPARKTNVNWQITSAHCVWRLLYTGDKVKLKVNVIWCLSISAKFHSRSLGRFFPFFLYLWAFYFFSRNGMESATTHLVLWFRMNLRLIEAIECRLHSNNSNELIFSLSLFLTLVTICTSQSSTWIIFASNICFTTEFALRSFIIAICTHPRTSFSISKSVSNVDVVRFS